jgi:hypothetical protein
VMGGGLILRPYWERGGAWRNGELIGEIEGAGSARWAGLTLLCLGQEGALARGAGLLRLVWGKGNQVELVLNLLPRKQSTRDPCR